MKPLKTSAPAIGIGLSVLYLMLVGGAFGITFVAVSGSLLMALGTLGASIAGLIAVSRGSWTTSALVSKILSVVVIILGVLMILITFTTASLPLTTLVAILGIVPAAMMVRVLRRLRSNSETSEES